MLFWTVIISTYLESLTCEASLSNIIYSVRRPLRTSVLERKHIVATVAEVVYQLTVMIFDEALQSNISVLLSSIQ